MDRRAVVAVGAVVAMFLAVQLGALALVEPFHANDLQAVDDPQDATNSLVYVAAILVATGGMLLAIRLGVDEVIRGAILLATAALSFYVFAVVVPPLVVVSGVHVLAVALAGSLSLGLLVHPEWYVIDAAGVVMGAGGAGIFGISFGLFPAVLLLAVLAVYDAISVYGTEHMLTLASGVMDLNVPVVLVVPLTLSYSFVDADPPQVAEGGTDAAAGGTPAGGGVGASSAAARAARAAAPPPAADAGEPAGDVDPLERDAFFVGLGDAVIPTVLVASAAFFAPPDLVLDVPGLLLTVPALGAMVGTLAGLLVLMRMVMAGRAHAGLPLLNGGALLGLVVASLAVGVGPLAAIGLA